MNSPKNNTNPPVNPSHEREQALFILAVAKPVAERAAFLERECGNDKTLRARLDALLAAHEESGGILPGPAARPTMKLELSDTPDETIGQKIGRYKILEKVGEGGCGVVYVAEQTEPVRRRVALKVIKLGMDTKAVVARFEAERQALAMMDHPNIAKVFDAGTTDTGRPYFIMELVRGIRITDYCDQNNLSTKDRLDLFIQVCQAIQHAHQKGIIHRDIKPSNILVTLHDGCVPVPKVIDFGIAKATEGKLTDATVYTQLHQFIGTPAYMSPEQAELSALDIDTRSDIYSLGVLLYELLTGKTPFNAQELMSLGIDAMRKAIREQDPVRPSTKLATLQRDELTTTARRRSVETSKLTKLLQGDLDWIVMKALEKNRTRRYGTANGFAADIQRHLDNEPVLARPPSELYRIRKLIGRNKLAFTAASIVVSALIIGLGVSTVMFFKEQQARRQAEAERKTAVTEAAKSQQVAQFLKDMLQGVGPSVALGRDTTLLREILDNTARRVGTELTNQPEVEADLRETLGVVYCDIGQYTNAQIMLEGALRLRKKLYGDEDLSVASALNNLGEVFRQQRWNADAEADFREALAIRRKLLGNENAEVADSLYGLAEVIRRKETLPALSEAEAAYREALAIRQKLLGNEDPAVASSLTGLGIVLLKENRLAESEACCREALDIQRKRLGPEHPEVAYTLCNLGMALTLRGKLAEAEAMLRQAVAIQKKVLGEHRDTAYSLNFLGNVLSKEGKPADAEQMHREALAIQRKVLGEHTDEGVTLDFLAGTLVAQGRLAEAEAAYREALAIQRKFLGDDHSYTHRTLSNLVSVLRSEGKFSEAELLLREFLASHEQNLPDDWMTFDSKSMLGGILVDQKKYTEAEPLLLSGYEGMKQRQDTIPALLDRIYLNEGLQRLVQFYKATGNPEQAAKWSKEMAELEADKK